MEQEGIYYYFRHTDGQHTLVLTDSTGKHTPAPGYDNAVVHRADEQVDSRSSSTSAPGTSRARSSRASTCTTTTTSSGRASSCKTQQDAAAQLHAERLRGLRLSRATTCRSRTASSTRRSASTSSAAQFETGAGGDQRARARRVGSLFTLERSPARRSEPRVPDRRAPATTCSSSDYESLPERGGTELPVQRSRRCRARSSSGRGALTPKPFVQGPQTAVVVGPAGEEIYTDKYGRVKVQFHWDRLRQEGREQLVLDPRVAAVGRQELGRRSHIPRIGQEVIVDFLEGDPDQPIITGRVYNAEQMPPYDAAGEQDADRASRRRSSQGRRRRPTSTRSASRTRRARSSSSSTPRRTRTSRSRTTRPTGSATTARRRSTTTRRRHVKHDRTETVDNNETITIHGNRTETVDKNETITIHMNRTETVDKNETITIGGNRTITVSKSETATVALQRTHTVGINETITSARRRRSRSAGCRRSPSARCRRRASAPISRIRSGRTSPRV